MFERISHAYLGIFRRCPLLVPLAIIAACGEMVYAILNNYAIPLLVVTDLHLRAAVLGWVTSTFLAAELLLKVPFGHWSDRAGRRPFIIAGPLLAFGSPIVMAFLPGRFFPVLFPLRAMDGVGSASLWPSVFASVVDVAEAESRVVAMSVLNTVYVGSVALGPALAGAAIAITGWNRSPFLLASALLAVAIGWAYFGLPAGLGRQERDGVSGAAAAAPLPDLPLTLTPDLAASDLPLGSGRPAGGLAVSPDSPAASRPVKRSLMPIILFITITQMMAVMMLAQLLVLYANQDLHIVRRQVLGLIFLVPAGIIAVLSIPIGHVVERCDRARAVQCALGVTAAGLWFIPFVHTLPSLMLLASVVLLAYTVGGPAWLALVADQSPTDQRGRTMGAFTTAQAAGALLGPVIGGHLWDISHGYPFIGSAILLSMAALAALIFLPRPGRPGLQRA
jgi:MFS family permease